MPRRPLIKLLSSVKNRIPAFTYAERKTQFGNMYSVNMKNVKITKKK